MTAPPLPPLLMLAGMRSLGESAEAYGWAFDQIQIALLPHAGGCGHVGATLITGGVVGPEVWAAAHAVRFGLRSVVYHADGVRTDSHGKPGRWAPEQLKATAHARDQQIADDLAYRARSGRRVVVVGLLDATNSKAARSGTAHRLACAESAGLAVQRFSWGLAPQQQEAAPAAAE